MRCFATTSRILVVAAASVACAGQETVVAPETTVAHAASAPNASPAPATAAGSSSANAAAATQPHATLRIESAVSFDVTLSYDDGLTFPITVAEGHNELAIPTGKMRWDRSWSGDCQYGPPGGDRELDAELRAGQTIRLRCSASMSLQNNMGMCCSPE
jgi:hypothetical protein